MKIEIEQRGACSLIMVEGRLDATWADYFADTLMAQLRQGRHWLVVDTEQLEFLSSAGIRAMMQVYKEINKVKGRFGIINPAEFVEQTLRSSGLSMWLDMDSAQLPPQKEEVSAASHAHDVEYYSPAESAVLSVEVSAAWRPWQALERGDVSTLAFDRGSTGLGIGAPLMPGADDDAMLGEFLVVAGNLVFQPPQEQTPADYLIAEESFVPRLKCAQALQLQGEMEHQLRFAPSQTRSAYSLSWLMETMLAHSSGAAVGFVILAEIDGLVGATLIRSPAELKADDKVGYPGIRDWLSFCGERSYAGHQALMVGVAAQEAGSLLPALPGAAEGGSGISAAHVHAAVFPHQPLQNGRIDMHEALKRFFSASPPLTLMHLVEDNRPVIGLGESSLIRGACWFGQIQNPEVLA